MGLDFALDDIRANDVSGGKVRLVKRQGRYLPSGAFPCIRPGSYDIVP